VQVIAGTLFVDQAGDGDLRVGDRLPSWLSIRSAAGARLGGENRSSAAVASTTAVAVLRILTSLSVRFRG